MKNTPIFSILLGFIVSSLEAQGQAGPLNPENWPTTINSTKKVHFVTTDSSLTAPSASWLADELEILNSGDQTTAIITIGGHNGAKATGNYLNVADHSFTEWADKDVIDIPVQVYGNAAVVNASGQPRNFDFLTGTLPELATPTGGQIPAEGKNNQWDWVLFPVANGNRASDGTRFVGFGEPEVINVFAAPAGCDPEPNTNLVGLDLNAGQTNHLAVLRPARHSIV